LINGVHPRFFILTHEKYLTFRRCATKRTGKAISGEMGNRLKSGRRISTISPIGIRGIGIVDQPIDEHDDIDDIGAAGAPNAHRHP